ncbi:YbaB/EbfC family nucleoid-associated protein [Streptomyces polygonati]|uniref:Nucleoid-associated protein ACFO3J_25570 n=1 Tax=Streptomyces polygonati TaxID=1617087 RepID=A0ABV8HVE8_9ACTN
MADREQVDFAALAQQARRMQGEVAGVQESLAAIQGTGFGGKGLVAATVSGEGRIVALRIDPSVIDPDDPETLADLVIEAVDSANQAAQEQRTQRMAGVTDTLNGLLAGLRPGESSPGDIVPRTRGQFRPPTR